MKNGGSLARSINGSGAIFRRRLKHWWEWPLLVAFIVMCSTCYLSVSICVKGRKRSTKRRSPLKIYCAPFFRAQTAVRHSRQSLATLWPPSDERQAAPKLHTKTNQLAPTASSDHNHFRWNRTQGEDTSSPFALIIVYLCERGITKVVRLSLTLLVYDNSL